MQLIEFLKALPWFLIGLALILKQRRLRINGVRPGFIVILYSIKMTGTLALQWLYTYYYTQRDTADIYRFYDDGLLLAKVASDNIVHYLKIILNLPSTGESFRSMYFEHMNAWIKPFESGFYNDNIFMIKLNSLFSIITQGGYESNSILFSALAFSGLILIIKTVLKDPTYRLWALIAISLLPSYLLFLSGGLKESVLLFGAGILFLGYDQALHGHRKTIGLILFAIGAWFLLMIKPYFIASVTPAILALIIVHKLKFQTYWTWGIWFIVLGIGVFSLSLLNFELLEFVVRKQHDFLNHSAEIEPGSAIFIQRLEYSWSSVLLSLPIALFRSLLTPLPWNVNSVSLIIMCIENIIILTIVSIGTYYILKTKVIHIMSHFLLQSILPALCLIGLISPVLGATMRYRAPFIILLVLAFLPSILSMKIKNEQHEI